MNPRDSGYGTTDRLKPGLQLLPGCAEQGWSPGFSLLGIEPPVIVRIAS